MLESLSVSLLGLIGTCLLIILCILLACVSLLQQIRNGVMEQLALMLEEDEEEVC